jgi:beta-lactam-binding protein with PASTA domain
VVGQAERTAEVVLAQTNLEIAGRVEIATDAYPAGTVVAQNPPATGRASKVALLVNRGRTGQTYVMPDLIGTPGARVVELLRRRGFRVTVSAEVPYPGIPGGVIVRQTPQAGYQVADGEPVLVEISR